MYDAVELEKPDMAFHLGDCIGDAQDLSSAFPMLDLCYEEDSHAMVDLNCVMTGDGQLIEIQGTGEGRPFTLEEQQKLVQLCAGGVASLCAMQRKILEEME